MVSCRDAVQFPERNLKKTTSGGFPYTELSLCRWTFERQIRTYDIYGSVCTWCPSIRRDALQDVEAEARHQGRRSHSARAHPGRSESGFPRSAEWASL